MIEHRIIHIGIDHIVELCARVQVRWTDERATPPWDSGGSPAEHGLREARVHTIRKVIRVTDIAHENRSEPAVIQVVHVFHMEFRVVPAVRIAPPAVVHYPYTIINV